MKGKLVFYDGTELEGKSFGSESAISGELVFSTGMTGYVESMTDPSYAGQILVFTYPLIGNYGVPEKKYWESDKIQISGLIVSTHISTPSHYQSKTSISAWLKQQGIPALEVKDTRFIAKKLSKQGATLGKIVFQKDIPFKDPNEENLVAKVSTRRVRKQGAGNKKIILVDCGAKRNIERNLLKRDVTLYTVPWDYDFSADNIQYDGVVISNGPGDPKMAEKTIQNVKKAMRKNLPIFGICLGNQILALAAGGDTYKLPFGHRGQNQPCRLVGTDKSYLTTQNHGFAVGKIPSGFREWFLNLNDNTNEGIIHTKHPFMSVQFHPESYPGPTDTEWLFDYFLNKV